MDWHKISEEDEYEVDLYSGDGPTDILGPAIEQIIDLYEIELGRKPYRTEINDALDFVLKPHKLEWSPPKKPKKVKRKYTKISSKKVLELLKEGWELAQHQGPESNYWMQKNLGCDGNSFEVHAGAFHSLWKKGIIVQFPKREKDPWYMVRYGLAEEKEK